MEMDYLKGLNGPQRSAVENYSGPTLIIAGAGSGKTRVLTMRIAHMLQQGISPRNIMALTFTNKAAREMRDRVAKILPPDAVRGLWMGTFHSLFSRILRAEATLLGFPEAFTIYDTADSRNLVKAIVRQLELPDDQYKPNDVYARISLAKNNLVLPEAYAANATLMEEDARAKRPRLAEIYALYMRQCRQNGAMDFDDLLLYMNILLRDHPEIARKYGDQFQYILVDEYQDTNYSQYLIVKKLADIRRNICVVGDDSQSIYSFRGARIENILRFQQDYPEARIFKLEQNYRSTRTIVEAANSVIENNSRKLPKHLFSENEQGDPIRVICAMSDKEEAQRVASDIHTTLYGEQASPDDFAVLYRTNAQSRVIEEYLRGNNIPYRIYGGQSFYQRAEIKEALAYLRLAINPRDDELYLRWIQFGVYSPILRLHSSNTVGSKDPACHPKTEREAAEALRFRVRLIPYIYTHNYYNYRDAKPLIQPLYYKHTEREAYTYKNEYYFGSELIVAPVTHKADKKTGLAKIEVWLPKARWIDIHTREISYGGKFTAYRDASSIPVYLREGGILPLASEDQRDTANPHRIELLLNPGNGKYVMFEDDGISNGYKTGGAFTKIRTAKDGKILKLTLISYGDTEYIPDDRAYKPNILEGEWSLKECIGATEKDGWFYPGPGQTTLVWERRDAAE